MKYKVIVELDIPEGATHYEGNLDDLEFVDFYKCVGGVWLHFNNEWRPTGRVIKSEWCLPIPYVTEEGGDSSE